MGFAMAVLFLGLVISWVIVACFTELIERCFGIIVTPHVREIFGVAYVLTCAILYWWLWPYIYGQKQKDAKGTHSSDAGMSDKDE